MTYGVTVGRCSVCFASSSATAFATALSIPPRRAAKTSTTCAPVVDNFDSLWGNPFLTGKCYRLLFARGLGFFAKQLALAT